jgi:hypothetical protein
MLFEIEVLKKVSFEIEVKSEYMREITSAHYPPIPI